MTRRCEHCGSWVSADWVRVMASEDGCHACPQCATDRQLHRGGAADPQRRDANERPQPHPRSERWVA
jgi:ribosome-binding protein aMBF1 (putative translation factor)